MEYGIICLLPVVVVISVALYTKRTFEALLSGAITAFIITSGFNGFFNRTIDAFYNVLCDADVVWVLLICALFGSLIKLFDKSNATYGIANFILKYAKTEKKSQLISWLLGIVIFVDDYLNVMTVGNTMRPVTDKLKSPREMLAYVIDCTAGPVCILIPFSTWVAFYIGLFQSDPQIAALGEGMSTYYRVIPFTFYNIITVILVPLFVLGIIPHFGPMKKAYERVNAGGKVYAENSEYLNKNDYETNIKLEGNLFDFIIPISVLIVLTIAVEDILIGVIGAIIACAAIYFPRRKMSFREFSESIAEGIGYMIPLLLLVFGAFLFKEALTDVDLANYIISKVQPYMIKALFPALTFVVVAFLAFVVGSAWGIPAVSLPLIMPLCFAVGANPYLTLGAILSAGGFGCHACFYADVTVMASQVCKIDVLDHALTQIPYALIAAFSSALLYLVFGIIL
jgi:Na+/H+ antiporter NhaC